MTKTLIVSYMPSVEHSNTKKLTDYLVENLKDKDTVIEHLDLEETQPTPFTKLSLGAYKKRNYMRQEISEAEKKSLERIDKLTEQIKSADYIVITYPIHNFQCQEL